jgi:hypothetical protein
VRTIDDCWFTPETDVNVFTDTEFGVALRALWHEIVRRDSLDYCGFVRMTTKTLWLADAVQIQPNLISFNAAINHFNHLRRSWRIAFWSGASAGGRGTVFAVASTGAAFWGL